MMAFTPLPYLVRNWVWYRDPIAFFGTSIFRNPNFHVSFEKELVRSQRHLNDVGWSELPGESTLGGPETRAESWTDLSAGAYRGVGLLWPRKPNPGNRGAWSWVLLSGKRSGAVPDIRSPIRLDGAGVCVEPAPASVGCWARCRLPSW